MPILSKPPVLFVAECHADTAILSIIRNVPARHPRTTRHLKGIGRVANTMVKHPDEVIIGLVDDDDHRKQLKLNEPSYFKDFQRLSEPAADGHLTFLKHRDRRHYLIRVTPACERWLYTCAQEASLSITFEQIVAVTKEQDSDTNPILIDWIKRIYRAQVAGFMIVESFITQFEDAPPRYY